MPHTILELADLVAKLPSGKQCIFKRIFSLDVTVGKLRIPSPMLLWVENQFGSIDRVTSQPVIKITNLITQECSVYNPLRVLRPHQFQHKSETNNYEDIEGDQFSRPLEYTAEDIFGRIKGKHCITAGNVAKYGQFHGVIIFDNPDPLKYGCMEVADYIETGWRWVQRVHEFDPGVSHSLFLWNCNNRAGASIRHGHAQVIAGIGPHYPRIEQLRLAALRYKEQYETDYFDDLFEIHRELGLAKQSGEIKTIAYLAALKQNEIMILSPGLGDSFSQAVWRGLSCFRDHLDVKSFNLGIVFSPFGDRTGWEGFPVIARMVDRGDTASDSSDIGAMEFYGANVINSDPFVTAKALG